MSGRWHGPLSMSFVRCSPQYKNSCNVYPLTFSGSQAAMYKGLSRSLILFSFQAPGHSISINVFELFFCCADVYKYIYWQTFPLSTSGTPNCVNMYYHMSKRMQHPRPSGEVSGAHPLGIVFCNTGKLWKQP